MDKVTNIIIEIDTECDERVGAVGMNQIGGVSIYIEAKHKCVSFNSNFIGEYQKTISNKQIIAEIRDAGYIVDDNVNIEINNLE